MKLYQLVSELSATPQLRMEFTLPNGKLIPSHYHLTEVARIQKCFIDCGGQERQLEFCTLQLWSTFDIDHRLTTTKFLKILNLSTKVLPSQDIDVEVEYEDQVISQYPIESIHVTDAKIILQLRSKRTDCLAKDACGVAPVKTLQPSCSPANGCC